MATVLSTAARRSIMSLAIGAGGALNGRTLRLSSASVTPTPTTLLAAFTEAAFAGYAAAAGFVFQAPYIDPLGVMHVDGTMTLFAATTGLPNETEYNWYLTDAPATTVYAAGRLDQIYPITVANNGVPALPDLPYGA